MKKDKKVLVYSAWAPNSIYTQSLFQQMTVLKEFAEDIHYMGSGATDAGYRKIKSLVKLPEDKFHYFQDNYVKFYREKILTKEITHWDDIIEAIDVTKLKDFDRIYLWGGTLSSVCSKREGQNLKAIKNYPKTLSKTWTSLGIHYIHVLALLKAHNLYKIPITELMYDNQEASLYLIENEMKVIPELYELKFSNEIPEYRTSRFDSIQYVLDEQARYSADLGDLLFGDDVPEKKYEFSFGYSCITEDRQIGIEPVLDMIKEKFKNPNLFIKDTFKGINTFIPREEYLDYISKSKYTLVIPAYDRTQMSIIRIIESTHNNCITLFTPDNNFDNILVSFPNFKYKDYIFDENFEKWSDEVWEERLQHLRDTFLGVKHLSIKGVGSAV